MKQDETHQATCLAINVGNTRTQLGCFVDGELIEQCAVDNQDAAEFERQLRAMAPKAKGPIVLASVNPTIAEQWEQVIDEALSRGIKRVERDWDIPVGRQLDRESLVGEDRLLNAAAAYEVLQEACVIVDAGTAITVDFVDGKGTFHGGAIAPGAQMMLDALHQRTAMLPEVEMHTPVEAIGHCTSEAMRSAAFHGLRGLVRELVEQYATASGVYPLVIATGGDAPMLFADYDLMDRIVPELALHGLAATVKAHQSNQPKL